MKHTILVVACVLLSAGPTFAGQRAKTGDPVTGSWTGQMASSDDERQPIQVELKFDGRTLVGLVTGPPYPGDITAGTFNPDTGALTFTVVVRDERKTVVEFTGALKEQTAAGRFVMNGHEGTFQLARQTPAASAAIAASLPKAGSRTREQMEADFQAHKGDFDYLLGDWEFTAHSKEYPNFKGLWSAVRLDDGQILDEYRIVGDKGETYYVTSTLRNYNKALERWELIGADAGTGLQDFGTGRRVGAEMQIEQKFGVSSGKPSTWKIRYYNITPESFSWSADRSTDAGKTWVKDYQVIEARRIGPARSLAPLTKKGGDAR
jgi:hypothetical protein